MYIYMQIGNCEECSPAQLKLFPFVVNGIGHPAVRQGALTTDEHRTAQYRSICIYIYIYYIYIYS